jgi:hypothetical protein
VCIGGGGEQVDIKVQLQCGVLLFTKGPIREVMSLLGSQLEDKVLISPHFSASA